MKKKFLKYALKSVKDKYPEFSDEKLDEIRYGLEGFYLSITKLVIILILSILLNITKETILILIFFNIVRASGFGLHATKSWICLLSSIIIFVLFPLLSKIIFIPLVLKQTLLIVGIILTYFFAPADTAKRPIISKCRREKLRFITTTNVILLSILTMLVNDSTLVNLIIFGMYNEIFTILPITYKVFNLSYNNYKNYNLRVS